MCGNNITQKVPGPSLPNLKRELIRLNSRADYIYRLPYQKLTEPWMENKTDDRGMKTHHAGAACKGFGVLLLLHWTPHLIITVQMKVETANYVGWNTWLFHLPFGQSRMCGHILFLSCCLLCCCQRIRRAPGVTLDLKMTMSSCQSLLSCSLNYFITSNQDFYKWIQMNWPPSY